MLSWHHVYFSDRSSLLLYCWQQLWEYQNGTFSNPECVADDL